MTKVCVVCNTFWPEIGAAPIRLTRWTEALCDSGCEVLVITAKPTYPHKSLYLHLSKQKFRYPIKRYDYWLYLGQNSIARLISMFSLFFSALRALPTVLRFSPDVVIGQSPPPAMATLAMLMAKLCRAKFILNVSDLWPEAISELLGKKRLWLLEIWMNFLYQNAQAITVQSQQIATKLKDFSPHVFRAGADESFFEINESTENQRLKIVYVGIIGLAHGLASLIKDFWPQNLELIVVGDGFEKKEIEEYLLKNPKMVFLKQAVPNEKVASILAQADVILVSQKKALYGTIPAKLYEAMAAGKPVWLNNSGAEAVELVENVNCGWVSNDQSFNAIVDKIVVSSPQERQTLGRNGREYAYKNLDGKQIAKRFANFVLDLTQKCKK